MYQEGEAEDEWGKEELRRNRRRKLSDSKIAFSVMEAERKHSPKLSKHTSCT